LNQIIAAAASVAFMAAPTIASAQQAPGNATTTEVAPAAEHVSGSQLEGNGWIYALVGVTVLILLIILVTDNNNHHNNDLPHSP